MKSGRFPVSGIVLEMNIYCVKRVATWTRYVLTFRSWRLMTVSANVCLIFYVKSQIARSASGCNININSISSSKQQ